MSISNAFEHVVDRKRHKISCENSVNFCGELRRPFLTLIILLMII